MEEELLTRQLPHSLEAEQSVLGSMLIDSRCVAEVIGMLQPDDFFLQQIEEAFFFRLPFYAHKEHVAI